MGWIKNKPFFETLRANIGEMQSRGCLVFGPGGSGKSTIAKVLADRMGVKHIDIDECAYNEDRRELRPREEMMTALLKELEESDYFIVEGAQYFVPEVFADILDVAIFVDTPTQERVRRMENRYLERHGVANVADLHEQDKQVLEDAATYDREEEPFVSPRSRATDEAILQSLSCPVARIDGMRPVEESVENIIKNLEALKQKKKQKPDDATGAQLLMN